MNYQMLVNKGKGLDAAYVPADLIIFSSKYKNNILLNKITYNSYLKLREEVLKTGYQMEVESGYRSFNYQQKVYDQLVEDKGEKYAKVHVAVPGHSEHQTGLCLDFCLYNNDNCYVEHEIKDLDITQYIHSILHNYGFVLRYPLGKESITGYDYEPWHIRYVGDELASYLYKNKITLDEYYMN